MIGELWIQTRIAIATFRYVTLCLLALVARKLQVICRSSTYCMNALLSEMSIFCVRTGCKVRKASHASKHAFPIGHFAYIQCTWTCNSKTSDHDMWTFSILNDCYIIGDILCVVRVALEIRLEGYGSRHASVVLSNNIVIDHNINYNIRWKVNLVVNLHI